MTAEETLGLLAERLFQSRLVRGAVVAVDGFVDFHAGAEAGAAGRLHDGAAQEVIVTVPADGRESFEDAGRRGRAVPSE